ncbi:MAG TPA: phytanoyl-CoA dioxygenase family protein [Candidatus Sulfotelmatobacter sp.]|nr:phytanoyl-CoA dioxygenase family protein [Candidatus Sulfotelmatobacter sp.]
MISQADVAFYREHGYVVVPDLVQPAMLARLQRVIDGLVERARAVGANDDVYDLEPSHRPDRPRVRRLKKPHALDPAFDELMRSEPILSVSRQLLGPAVRLYGSKLNIKAPEYGSPVEWHQDWAFYPHTNDDVLAVGVMLNDCQRENGPLMVMPGSHQGPTWDHHADGYFCGAIDPDACPLDFSKAVALTGRAGACSFHHVRLVHGSAQNTSALPRQLLLYELAAADAWPLVTGVKDLAEFDSRMLCGTPSIEPRIVACPVRMPLPPALGQGSIYENQFGSRRRYFAFDQKIDALEPAE